MPVVHAHPVHHLQSPGRRRPVDRPAGPSDPRPPKRPHHRGLRPCRRGRLRAHAKPRGHNRSAQASLGTSLATSVGGNRLAGSGTSWSISEDRPWPGCSPLGGAPSSAAPGQAKINELAAVLKLKPPPLPVAWIGESDRSKVHDLLPGMIDQSSSSPQPRNWQPKVWPAERFAAVFHQIATPDTVPVILGGPGPAERCIGRTPSGSAARGDRPRGPPDPARGFRLPCNKPAFSSATIPA